MTDDGELSEKEKREQRLGAWAEIGATNFPALLIALGAGALGGLRMLIRRRKRA